MRIAACIVTIRNRTLSPSANRFIECVREVAKPVSKTSVTAGQIRLNNDFVRERRLIVTQWHF